MTEKLLNALGLASSGKKMFYGEKLLDLIKQNKVRFVIISTDMGESQKKKFLNKCNFYNVPYNNEIIDSTQLCKAMGLNNVKAVGFNDDNIIKLITQYI